MVRFSLINLYHKISHDIGRGFFYGWTREHQRPTTACVPTIIIIKRITDEVRFFGLIYFLIKHFLISVLIGFCCPCFIIMLSFKGGNKMNTDKIYAEQIANEYSEKQTSKVKALKRLDAKAKNPAYIFAYTFGIVSSLVLGTGMSFAMGIIGGGSIFMIALGIIIGCVGILGVSINYYLFKRILDKNKKKYANDILELAKEISEEE